MSFLRHYINYNSGNECPDNFHIWTALSILSSTVGAKVKIDRSYFTIYTNLFVCLVGLQGSRKTTAKDIGFDLLKEAIPDVQVSSECESKEFITKYLADPKRHRKYKTKDGKEVTYTPYSIFATELKNFLAMNQVSMVDFLTAIYDRTGKQYESKTKNKGEDSIPSPFVNFLACETPEWLAARLKDSVISGGFCRRMVFVYETNAKPPIAFPQITPDGVESRKYCLNWLRKIKDVEGVFQWGPGTAEWFINWYNETKAKKQNNPFMEGWYSSKDAQLLKVAMLVALSEDTELTLQLNHLQYALAIIDNLEVNLPKLVSTIGRNELAIPTGRLLDVVTQHGKIPEKTLQGLMYNDMTPMEFLSVLNHLKNTEQLVVCRLNINGVERSYVMTKDYFDKNVKKI